MTIAYSKNFIKQAKKLHPSVKEKLYGSLKCFANNPLHPALRNHALNGKYRSYRSIDITGDVRALYLQQEDRAVFDTIGTHSQLYG